MHSVSVVIPCYNGSRFLAEAIASVRRQTRPPQELLVVDDGSTDGSGGLAESLGATVLRQENQGEGAARNTGLRSASGDFVAWLDADDRWRPQHLQVVAGLLERNSEAAGAFGAVQRFGLRDELIPGYVPIGPPSRVLTEAFRDWLHTTISAVVRRDALLTIGGFDESERYSVDFDLWLRLARHFPFVATHEVTADWRWHDAQQSSAPMCQLASVYRSRARFIEVLRRDGELERASQLHREFQQAWERDLVLARNGEQGFEVQAVDDLATLVQGSTQGELRGGAVIRPGTPSQSKKK